MTQNFPSRHFQLRHRLAIILGAALLAFAARPAYCEYPERVIRAIVPFAPGGTNDLMARLISPHLGKSVGQSVIVENRPGAAGNVGIEIVAKAAPDGYTIIYSATASTQNPALFRNMRFDPINDIQPVAAIADFPYAITVNRQLPVKTAMDLANLARKNPGKLSAAAGGIGTRLSIELFKIKTNTAMEVIPYNGTGPAALAVSTGEADFAIADISGFSAFIPTGRVRILAVAGDKRLPSMPDVPTTTEAGMGYYKAGTTAALYTTARTPMAIVQKLNAAINQIVVLPDVSAQIQKLGGNPAPASVEDLTRWYRSEIQTWKDIVKRANIPPVD